MKRKRFSVEQIVSILKQAEVGVPVVELCRQAGITEQALLPVEEAVRRPGDRPGSAAETTAGRERPVEETDGGAEPGQDHAPGCADKKILKPSRCRPVVSYLSGAYRVSLRRACRVVRVAISTYRYRSMQEPRTALRLRIREITQARVRYE